MKCKKCGANYKTRELSCPYCNTENLIGKIWMKERSDAELEYENTRKSLGKRIFTYSVNRILNRTLLIMLITCILTTVAVIFGIVVKTMFTSAIDNSGKENREQKFERLLNEGRYSEFAYEVLENDSGSMRYMQAALMINDYEEYISYKYKYLSMSDEDKREDDFYLEYSIKNSVTVYTMDYYKYSELHTKNVELHDMYAREIESYWKSVLGLSDEDIEFMIKEDYLDQDEMEKLVGKAKEATIND